MRKKSTPYWKSCSIAHKYYIYIALFSSFWRYFYYQTVFLCFPFARVSNFLSTFSVLQERDLQLSREYFFIFERMRSFLVPFCVHWSPSEPTKGGPCLCAGCKKGQNRPCLSSWLWNQICKNRSRRGKMNIYTRQGCGFSMKYANLNPKDTEKPRRQLQFPRSNSTEKMHKKANTQSCACLFAEFPSIILNL